MTKRIRHDNETNRLWHIGQIFTGQISSAIALHVPNVNDIVYDPAIGLFIVSFVDSNTDIPTLTPWVPPNLVNNTVEDTLWGNLQANRIAVSNRVMVNYSETPAVVNFNGQYLIYETEAVTARLFRGTDTSVNGTIISRRYNSTGNLIGDDIQVDNVFTTNPAIRRPRACNVDVVLNAGETVTLVYYSSTGAPIWADNFKVSLGNAIRPLTLSTKYLTDVSLVSDLIDESDLTLIKNEVNVPFSTAMLRCRLHYTDGSSTVVDIDGNKAVVYGLDGFNTSLVGPTKTIALAYYPSSSEPTINAAGSSTKPVMIKSYRMQNIMNAAEFALKLYVVPVYQGLTDGYELRFFLTNLRYDDIIDVTEDVTFAKTNGQPYVPAGYASTQLLRATLRLDDVVPGLYPGYVHVQDFTLTLHAPTLGDSDAWIIDYNNDAVEPYGVAVVAEFSSAFNVFNIKSGRVRIVDWIDIMYKRSKPLFDSELVGAAPEPTHFDLEYEGITTRYGIGDWNTNIPKENGVTVTNFSVMKFKWLRIDDGVEKHLAITPVMVKIV